MLSEVIIRPEREEEFGTIYDLIKTAFATAKVKDGDEQNFAEWLRGSSGYISELALVAEYSGEIIAHLMLTRTKVTQPDGTTYEGLLLAPVAVLIEWRDKGVGSTLIREALKRGRDAGWKSVFVCGDPAYYERFGFRPISQWGLGTSGGDIPLQYVMAVELEDGALNGVKGTVDFC